MVTYKDVTVAVKYLNDVARFVAGRHSDDHLRNRMVDRKKDIYWQVFDHIEKLDLDPEQYRGLKIDVKYRKCHASIWYGKSYRIPDVEASKYTGWGITIEESYPDGTCNTRAIDPQYDSPDCAIRRALVLVDDCLLCYHLKMSELRANHEQSENNYNQM